MKFIDAHGHINFPDYENDRDLVVLRAKEQEVGIVTVGTDLITSREVIKLTEKYGATGAEAWAIIGAHPVKEEGKYVEGFKRDEFLELARHPKVVAIGECGIDFFHSSPEDTEAQKKVFIEQIKIANEVGKPLMLHMRNGKNGENAYQVALFILREYAKVPFNFHFFAGGESDLNDILNAGGMVSFTGVITFARSYDELIKQVPLDRMMSETDCPFVAPIPYRGKRNEPSYVIEVVKKIAEIRGEDFEMVREKLVENAKRFFWNIGPTSKRSDL